MPLVTSDLIYLAKVIDATLSREMRNEAVFLRANDRARTAIKDFLEAPDHELEGIIRSVRENGNVISNHLRKRYPRLAEQPELGERIVEAVAIAFTA